MDDYTGWWICPAVGSEEYFAACLGPRHKLQTPNKCSKWKKQKKRIAVSVATEGRAIRVRTQDLSFAGVYQLEPSGREGTGGRAQIAYRRIA